MIIGFWRRENHLGVMQGIWDYYKSQGHKCIILDWRETLEPPFPTVEVAILWNGTKPSIEPFVKHCRKVGAQLIFAEHGHFRHKKSIQVDVKGINADSTNRWWKSFPDPTEDELHSVKKKRYDFFTDTGIKYEPPEDYILVALQVATDVNITKFAPQFVNQGTFVNIVKQCIMQVTDCPVVWRQHPKIARGGIPPLPQHLNRCKYLITINSNTVHEALMAKKDCICLAPQIYIGSTDAIPGEGGVVFSCMGKKRRLLRAIVEAERRCKEDICKEDPTRDQYINYVYDREWPLHELATDSRLDDLLKGKPKRLGCRAEMTDEWHTLRGENGAEHSHTISA